MSLNAWFYAGEIVNNAMPRAHSDLLGDNPMLAHAGKQGRRVVAAFIATAFAQEDGETARGQCRQVADQIRP